MKKVININFQGRVVPIEETAYDMLKQYIESLQQYFSNEEGSDEIINDIEGRIAELFSETLKKGSTCITDDDVEAIIKSMGRPADFEADEINLQSKVENENRKSQSESKDSGGENTTPPPPHRLYRDENDKVVAGVCAGLANYFNIDRVVVRILFVIFFGALFIPYLILWVAVPSTASTVIGSTRKRLYRDPENCMIGGVCSGIAHYFNINIWIPRVIFLIPFITFLFRWSHFGPWNFPSIINFTFSPGATIIYIILWIAIPEAKSTSEKLEMKGEKVDLNSIKTTIQQDMAGVKDRAKKFGAEVKERAQEIGSSLSQRSKSTASEAISAGRRSSGGLGKVIILLFKIFAYFILGCIVISLVIALLTMGISFAGFLPYKVYLINDGWQTVYLWGTLLLFIWVPVIGIITWIIRRIANTKSHSNFMTYTFIALWTLGWASMILLVSSLTRDFGSHNTPREEVVSLENPLVNKLELKNASNTNDFIRSRWWHFEPFVNIDEDTIFLKNNKIKIVKSLTDSFSVKMFRVSNGSSRPEANALANKINYPIYQKDSSLFFGTGIAITPKEKFRNQGVYITIAVPVGKRIIIDKNVGWNDYSSFHFGNDFDDYNWRNFNDEGLDWDHNVEYIMTESGLKRVHPALNDQDDQDEDKEQGENPSPSQDSVYRYKQPRQSNDSLKKVSANTVEKEKVNIPMSSLFMQRFLI
ncbi:MAG: PspC domain-containing protein [Bacteroidetes bacterium]|nr:PspC domain-containing protein [Bacteroidota bacterium]